MDAFNYSCGMWRYLLFMTGYGGLVSYTEHGRLFFFITEHGGACSPYDGIRRHFFFLRNMGVLVLQTKYGGTCSSYDMIRKMEVLILHTIRNTEALFLMRNTEHFLSIRNMEVPNKGRNRLYY